MKIYTYKKCSTCKKATQWLDNKGIEYEELAIRETPPSIEELRKMLEHKGNLKPLFNSSGMDYRSLGMKDKLPNMTEDEALVALHETGNLVKRPFVVSEEVCLVGFKEAEWDEAFS